MPASASAIRAGRAFVELFADDTKLVRGLKAAQAKLKAFGATVTKIGAVISAAGASIVAPMLAATKDFASVGDAIAKMSARTGIGVEALSQLNFAAGQAGADLQTLEKGIRKMQQTITEAGNGSKTYVEAFEALGLSVNDLVSKSPEEQFLAIADAISQVDDPTKRAAAAMDVFGKSGAQLIPFMSGGAAGIRDLMQQADALGLTLSGEDAKAAEIFSDAMDALLSVIRRTAVSVGAALAPALSNIIDKLTGGATSIARWVDEHREMIRIVAAVGAGLVALGAAIGVAGAAFAAMATVAGIVAGTIAAIGAVIGAIVSKVGIVAAALVAGVGAWLVYSESGQAALAELSSRFSALKTDALAAFQGIADALAAGDIALAGEVAMAGLNVVWQHGLNLLRTAWVNFLDVFLEAWINISTSFQKGWADAIAGATILAAQAGTKIQGVFEDAAASFLEFVGLITEEEANFARAKTKTDREAALQADIDAALSRNAAANKELEDARKAAQEARAKGTAADIAAAEAGLESARRKLAESVKRAAEARASADATDSAKAPSRIRLDIPDLDDLQDKLSGAADKMAKATDELPSLMAKGSQEAAEAIARHANGAVDDEKRLQRDQLAEQKKATQTLRDIDKNIRKIQTLETANIA